MYRLHCYRNPRYRLSDHVRTSTDTSVALGMTVYNDRADAERRANQLNRNGISTNHVYVRHV